MTLMKAKKPLALLLALLAALSLLGTTALAAGLPEETIAAQTELCGEDCGHTHEEVFSHTEHAEESLPEPKEIAVPVATPLLEQPEPEAEQPSDTSGVIPGSGIYWELNEYGWLMLSGNGSCSYICKPGTTSLGRRYGSKSHRCGLRIWTRSASPALPTGLPAAPP